jgi:hypothetical protein
VSRPTLSQTQVTGVVQRVPIFCITDPHTIKQTRMKIALIGAAARCAAAFATPAMAQAVIKGGYCAQFTQRQLSNWAGQSLHR